MSFTAARTSGCSVAMISFVKALFCGFVRPGLPARTSPASTMRLVVTSVSQATRASASAARNASTTVSEIRSATLSGWPSETLSLVKTYELRATRILRSPKIRGPFIRRCGPGRKSEAHFLCFWLVSLALGLFGQSLHQLHHPTADLLALD